MKMSESIFHMEIIYDDSYEYFGVWTKLIWKCFKVFFTTTTPPPHDILIGFNGMHQTRMSSRWVVDLGSLYLSYQYLSVFQIDWLECMY
jgi:hypothetical protein